MARRALNAKGELLEPAFQTQVVGLLRVYQWSLIYHAPDGGHAPAQGRRRVAGGQIPEGRGFPDILAIRGARLLVAELKTNTGRMRPGQQEWLDGLNVVACAVNQACQLARIGAAADPDLPEPEPGWPSVEVYLWRPRDWDVLHDVIRGSEGRRRDLDTLDFA